MMRKLILLITSIIIVSCSSNIKTNTFNKKYTALKYNEPVYILKLNEKNPTQNSPIGNLTIGTPKATFDCGYNKVINDARANARKIGANIIHLTEVKKPSKSSFGNLCYRIKANFYQDFDSKTLNDLDKIILARNKSRLPKDADYAMVYFYKPKI